MVNNDVKDCNGFKENKPDRLDKLIPGNKDKLLIKIVMTLAKFNDCKLAFNSEFLQIMGLLFLELLYLL